MLVFSVIPAIVLFGVNGISTNYSAKCLGGLICDLVRDAVID